MNNRWVPQSRAERLIAGARLVLAVASLGAIYLDPLEPQRHVALTYSLLAAYALYSAVLMVWTALASGSTRRAQLIGHTIDLAFFGTINYLTSGPTSPFFIYFVFGIVCAMLRFGRRGTIVTAVVSGSVFLVSSALHLTAIEFELNRFIIRSCYLTVLAVLLVHLAGYQQQMEEDLARIARWPRTPSTTLEDLLRGLMREAASIFQCARVLVVYDHQTQRSAFIGFTRPDGSFEIAAEPVEAFSTLLEADVEAFVSRETYRITPGMIQAAVRGSALPKEIVERYGIGPVVATSFKGELVRGRLLLLDGRQPLLEEVNLARITGGLFASRLDHFHAAARLQRGAVAEERVRVARDLHDSVLQSLTGIALQLKTLPRLMARSPEEAQRRFAEIEEVLATEQAELRWFIDQLDPERRPAEETSARISEGFTTLPDRYRRQWGLEVENHISPTVDSLPIGLRYQVFSIVNEAVANAAKHAAARRVKVGADVVGGDVRIDVSDDGSGFAFRGRYDLAELTATKRGPTTLKARVSALGGDMLIESSAAGSRLLIRVPLEGQA